VGSLKEDIVEGKTGFVCRPRDASDLAEKLRHYFESDLFRQLDSRRKGIRDMANDRNSWARVADITAGVYEALLNR
jgi:glycosyltransferase involved in cell wall biosynthesis